ncbi:MAG: outer membrane lipoprotein carrier protein LolA [Ignavibacteriaceae bacterium]|nr:outer membrane lipoprotein carrier protein LolA [Ignavibacteriaceae bacterium]
MRYLLLILILMAAAELPAQQTELLDAMKTKFNSLSSILADFTQSVGGKQQSAGSFLYKKPGKLKIALGKFDIITDGKTVWNVNAGEKKVVISNLDDENLNVLSLDRIVNELPALCTYEKINDNSFRLTAKGKGVNFRSVTISLNADNLITYLGIVDLNNMTLKISFSNVKTNVPAPDGEFGYKENGDYKVVDLR